MSGFVRRIVLSVFLLISANDLAQAKEACGLLTAADAEAIFGSAVEKALDETVPARGMTMLQCRYRAVAKPVRYADLTVTRYESAELFELLTGEGDVADAAVPDLGERAVWHTEAGSLSVFMGTEELLLHVFDQPDRFSKEAHIAVMREILARR